MVMRWMAVLTRCGFEIALIVLLAGCTIKAKEPAVTTGLNRVVVHKGHPVPRNLKIVIDAPTSVDRIHEFSSDRITEQEAIHAVTFVLQRWDDIPLTSAAMPFRDRYSDLRAEGYEGDGMFVFELFKDCEKSKMVIAVPKDSPVVLLINQIEVYGDLP